MSTVQAASARLAASRARLHQAMQEVLAPPLSRSGRGGHGSGNARLDRLKSFPGIGAVVDALGSWWSRHPLRFAGIAAANTANAMVQPIAQRNPWGLVLGALVAGGLFAWSRPWRWILKPALFVGLVPQVVTKVITRMPSGLWMALWSACAQEQHVPHRALAARRAADATGTALDTGKPKAHLQSNF